MGREATIEAERVAMPEDQGALVGDVAIGVITYRRPVGLERLLESLARLCFPTAGRVRPRVIVVDNDPVGSARALVEAATPAFPWPLTYAQEMQKGVVHARNRAFAMAAGCESIAFVDDDEIVEPNWLDALLTARRRYDADLVAGPVLPIFEESPPAWIRAARAFEPSRRLATGTAPVYVGAGNLLLRREALDRLVGPFDQRFGLTGGEDTFMHLQLMALDARLVWCDEAIAHEFVPPARMTFRWIVQRAYRNGNVAALCERAHFHGGRPAIPSALKGLARLLIGVVGLVPAFLGGRGSMTSQATMIARGVGRVAGALGHAFEGYKGDHAA